MKIHESTEKDFFVLAHTLKDSSSYPQHQTMGEIEGQYDYNAPNSVHKLWPDQFLDIQPNFNSIYLAEDVTLTDKISSAPIPWYVMIVSKKLLEVLKSFNLPPYRIYPVPVVREKKVIRDYFAIHILIPHEYLDEVDFSNSTFWLTTMVSKEKIKQLTIESSADLEKVQKQYSKKFEFYIRAEDFSLNRSFLEHMDLFALPGGAFSPRFFVSSTLRNEIERMQCTGIRFIDRHNWEESDPFWPSWSYFLRL